MVIMVIMVIMVERDPRIVSVCVSGFVGTNEAQRSIARGSKRIRHFVLSEPRINGPETRFLVEHFAQLQPRTIIVGGWSEYYEPFLALASDRIRLAVYWTSSGAQTELGGDLTPLLAVLAERRIEIVLFLDPGLAASPLARLKPTRFLPCRAPAAPLPYDDGRHRRRPHGPAVLSLFCSPHEYVRKNVLNALLAVAALNRPYVLYVNGLSAAPVYATLLKELDIRFRDFGWMDRDTYVRVLDDVDLGLQVSFVESYGQVVVDHLVRGIPVVASGQMPVLRNLPARIRQTVLVAHSDDWRDIRATVEHLLDRRDASRRLARVMFRQIQSDDRKRRRILNDVLRGLS